MEIADKVIVVTGGGSGLGAQTAQYLGKKGALVAIVDFDHGLAKVIAEKINGLAVRCDVSHESDAENAFSQITQELGPPRICINCAGIAPAQCIIGRDGPMSLLNFEKVIQVNLIGTFNFLRLSAAIMSKLEPIGKDQERGVIINTASIAAYEGQIGQAAYSASKGGICALTLPAARELAKFKIRVMTIAPGLFQTPLMENLPEQVQVELTENILFPRRLGQPYEFSLLVSHIIENTYLNGEVIRLDAGLRMQAS